MLGGEANWTAFAIGAGTLAVILLLKRFKRIPGILIAVVAATVAVGMLDLGQSAGVKVLGPLPQGLPSFAVPWIRSRRLRRRGDRRLCRRPGIVRRHQCPLPRLRGARPAHYVDPNQEMVGLGAANLATGFFQGFPISSSSSRTPVAEAAGARTQLTGVVGAAAVALLLLWRPI